MIRSSKLLVILAAVAAASVLAACGSSSSSSSSAASAGGAPTSAARTKLRTCLKAHGINLPSRPGGFRRGAGQGGGFFGGNGGPPGAGAGAGRPGGLRSNPKFQAAFKACGVHFAIRGRFSPAARKKEINTFVTCVRQHGYQLPTPNLSGKGSVFPAGIEHNAKFQKAARACSSALRAPGAAGGPPQGSASGGGSASST